MEICIGYCCHPNLQILVFLLVWFTSCCLSHYSSKVSLNALQTHHVVDVIFLGVPCLLMLHFVWLCCNIANITIYFSLLHIVVFAVLQPVKSTVFHVWSLLWKIQNIQLFACSLSLPLSVFLFLSYCLSILLHESLPWVELECHSENKQCLRSLWHKSCLQPMIHVTNYCWYMKTSCPLALIVL